MQIFARGGMLNVDKSVNFLNAFYFDNISIWVKIDK